MVIFTEKISTVIELHSAVMFYCFTFLWDRALLVFTGFNYLIKFNLFMHLSKAFVAFFLPIVTLKCFALYISFVTVVPISPLLQKLYSLF